jgi:hypothetical protein
MHLLQKIVGGGEEAIEKKFNVGDEKRQFGCVRLVEDAKRKGQETKKNEDGCCAHLGTWL